MALPIAFVVMHIMVWDADTGKLLENLQPDLAGSFSISRARIEDCRVLGLERAKRSLPSGASPIQMPSRTLTANGIVPASPHKLSFMPSRHDIAAGDALG